ncbi:hypothetical protein TBLA_0B08790 [Henningerozyma blattae CBS 6284]|uniref:GATA-type domain-containing protein n=1 Tax=Henningerozyma blattae (strain ATCC 34711 / CBS 6284 / DSM 70876 / NBRC 10599 / NRRL Y-10934 / UCD 77-7) TaxID=1071380 RepID=I2GZZ3_HENB6|nr:hypothetical protein TBLA_0B08790 [Tetrapisispora blattae CBS 6284]CCH59695.1 hypothetical protein TBLA_0B08790 [Tetrapisispora blattae CBS 6284]
MYFHTSQNNTPTAPTSASGPVPTAPITQPYIFPRPSLILPSINNTGTTSTATEAHHMNYSPRTITPNTNLVNPNQLLLTTSSAVAAAAAAAAASGSSTNTTPTSYQNYLPRLSNSSAMDSNYVLSTTAANNDRVRKPSFDTSVTPPQQLTPPMTTQTIANVHYNNPLDTFNYLTPHKWKSNWTPQQANQLSHLRFQNNFIDKSQTDNIKWVNTIQKKRSHSLATGTVDKKRKILENCLDKVNHIFNQHSLSSPPSIDVKPLEASTTKKRVMKRHTTGSFSKSFSNHNNPRVQRTLLPAIDTITIKPIESDEDLEMKDAFHPTMMTPPNSQPMTNSMTTTYNTKLPKKKRNTLLKRYAVPAKPNVKCFYCSKTSTPEWRRGPQGNRTLCNACGLYYRKLIKKFGYENANLLLRYRNFISSTDRRVPTIVDVPNSFVKMLNEDETLNPDWSAK